jgi:hypothetical protein
MSAPDTNVEKQEKRHRPALWGIKGALVWGALMLLLIVGFSVMRGEEPTSENIIGDEGAVQTEEVEGVTVDPVEPGTNVSN